jgi:hypothetical protein
LALKREHPVLKNMKILDFFLFLWVIFALLDPDPDPATQSNADPCGSGSKTLRSTTRLIIIKLIIKDKRSAKIPRKIKIKFFKIFASGQ